MKTLIVLSSVAGAGKSTWAEQYRKTHHHVHIVSSDELRKEITGKYSDMSQDKLVWETYFKRINELCASHHEVTVIADSTNILNKWRLQYKDVPGFDKKVLVVIRKDLPVILKQNLERSEAKQIPEEAIKWMYEHFEEPSQEVLDIYDEYIQVQKWFDSSKVKESFHYKE